MPFFGGGKLVWLKNANCMGDSVIGRSAAVQGALEDLAEVLETGLGSDVTLLISATEVDKRRSFYKTLGKRAERAGDRPARFVARGLGRGGDGDRAAAREGDADCSSMRKRSIFSCC